MNMFKRYINFSRKLYISTSIGIIVNQYISKYWSLLNRIFYLKIYSIELTYLIYILYFHQLNYYILNQ